MVPCTERSLTGRMQLARRSATCWGCRPKRGGGVRVSNLDTLLAILVSSSRLTTLQMLRLCARGKKPLNGRRYHRDQHGSYSGPGRRRLPTCAISSAATLISVPPPVSRPGPLARARQQAEQRAQREVLKVAALGRTFRFSRSGNFYRFHVDGGASLVEVLADLKQGQCKGMMPFAELARAWEQGELLEVADGYEGEIVAQPRTDEPPLSIGRLSSSSARKAVSASSAGTWIMNICFNHNLYIRVAGASRWRLDATFLQAEPPVVN